LFLLFQEAFIETAKKIYQNIQDGSLDLNAAESGVQHKPSAAGTGSGGTVLTESGDTKESCNC
jgi:Ras-related protein Rab-14